jgi:hypothetical protein
MRLQPIAPMGPAIEMWSLVNGLVLAAGLIPPVLQFGYVVIGKSLD